MLSFGKRYQAPFWIPEIGELAFPHDLSYVWHNCPATTTDCYGDVPWDYDHAIDPLFWAAETVRYDMYQWEVERTGRDLFGNVYLLSLPFEDHEMSPDYAVCIVSEAELEFYNPGQLAAGV